MVANLGSPAYVLDPKTRCRFVCSTSDGASAAFLSGVGSAGTARAGNGLSTTTTSYLATRDVAFVIRGSRLRRGLGSS